MKPMITNGGPHPADKWADMTTDTILDLIKIDDDSATPEAAVARAAKRNLKPVLFDIFNGHHSAVQAAEKGNLARAKKSMLTETLNVTHHMTIADEVDAALAATPFGPHLAKPEVKAVIRQIIGQHTADVMHIERRWHADRLAARGA